MTATDTYNNLSQMRFSNDNSTWSDWETYSTAKTWTISTANQGETTVYGQVSDTVGNIASASDTIIYDSVAPETTIAPAAGKVYKGAQVTLSANETGNIHYTLDGSTPTASSTAYSSALTINSDTTVKYFAVDSAGNSEAVKIAAFTIKPPVAIITSPGPGGGPQVRAFNAQGQAQAKPNNLMAFSSTFRGGVHVAACDVNGDGLDELVTSIGSQEEPWVKVYTQDKVLITSFLAYARNIRGGVFVACGDLNGDGKGEIVTGVPEGFGPHVRVFNGQTGRATITAGFFAYQKNVRTGIRVAVGDLDGNGQAEIIVGTGKGAGTHVRTFTPTGQAVFTPGFFVYGLTDRTGINVGVGDLDGSGQAKIISGSGVGRSGEVKVYDRYGVLIKSFSSYGANYKLGVKVTAGDIDSDGVDEIITGTSTGGGPQVKVFEANGTPISSFMAYGSTFRGGVDVAVGQLNN